MIARTLGLLKQLVPDAGLLRSSAIVLVGDSTARLLGFLFSVAAARLLMPVGYGRIAYALAVAAILSVLTTNSPALPFLFADPAAPNYRQRFYRVLLGP